MVQSMLDAMPARRIRPGPGAPRLHHAADLWCHVGGGDVNKDFTFDLGVEFVDDIVLQ